MRIRNALLFSCCALLATAVEAQPGFPQPTLVVARSTPARFSLSPAGPRALGLGGAFVAVADDPTAADANPAGLARLDRPQVATSLRSCSFETEFQGGFVPGQRTTSESVTGPAFAGYAHPLGAVTLAGYYQQDGRFASGGRFEVPEVILDRPDLDITVPFSAFDERRYDQRVETLGVAAGVRLGRAASLGATLRYQRLSIEWLDELGFNFPLIAPPPLDFPPDVGARSAVDDDDTDLTLALGLLVHPEGRWTGGLSYQQGGDYRLDGTTHLTGFVIPLPLVPYEVRMALPDVVSAGAAFRPRERWLLSAQVSHLTYSDLRSDPLLPFGDPGSLDPTSPFGGDEPIDDGTQLHLGAEVRLGTAERPFILRAGAWSDPDHDGIRGVDSDQVHAALGAGTTLRKGWDLDGALHYSDAVTEGVLAVGYRF